MVSERPQEQLQHEELVTYVLACGPKEVPGIEHTSVGVDQVIFQHHVMPK